MRTDKILSSLDRLKTCPTRKTNTHHLDTKGYALSRPLLRVIGCLTLLALSANAVTHNDASMCRAGEFRAGAARVDITPPAGISLDGPISKNGPVTGVNDPLHARALVLDDGETRLAIVICDLCMVGRDVVDQAKEYAAKPAGCSPERILIAATHTHAAVRAVHVGTTREDDEYHELLAKRIAEAIVRASQHLAPARVAHVSFQRPELISCRRFLCEAGSVGPNPFGDLGEQIKSVSGRSDKVLRPAGPVDPQFSVLAVQHRDGKSLAVLGNFSVHYCGGYRRGIVSADYFGHYAAALEQEYGGADDRPAFVGIMSNGTSGNTGAIRHGGKQYKPYEWMKVSARSLADDTVKVMANARYDYDVRLTSGYSELELGVRLPSPARIEWAKAILDGGSAGETAHRWEKVYAQEAIHLSKRGPTVDLPMQVLGIGPIRIAAVPCEVFAESGLWLKKNSPSPQTFTIELANGYGGYLPPAQQHKLGGYETWPARSSFLEVEAEQKICQELLRLLKELE